MKQEKVKLNKTPSILSEFVFLSDKLQVLRIDVKWVRDDPDFTQLITRRTQQTRGYRTSGKILSAFENAAINPIDANVIAVIKGGDIIIVTLTAFGSGMPKTISRGLF